MEVDSANNDIFQMIERFIILKVNVKAIFNTHLHLHRDDFCLSFDWLIWQQYSEISFFDYIELPCYNDSNEVADSTCDTIECFVVFFKIWKLELVLFIFAEDACRF
jgi:hypothetical protein